MIQALKNTGIKQQAVAIYAREDLAE